MFSYKIFQNECDKENSKKKSGEVSCSCLIMNGFLDQQVECPVCNQT